jgi:hypothetical protein
MFDKANKRKNTESVNETQVTSTASTDIRQFDEHCHSSKKICSDGNKNIENEAHSVTSTSTNLTYSHVSSVDTSIKT